MAMAMMTSMRRRRITIMWMTKASAKKTKKAATEKARLVRLTSWKEALVAFCRLRKKRCTAIWSRQKRCETKAW